MFALDLFNTDHERRIAEGAVDQLEQRRIDDLAMKMDDLVARAKDPAYKKNPAALSALMKEFQKCKAERDGYFKIKDECMGYGGLGEAGIGQDVVNKQEKMARATPSTPTSKVASTVKNAAKWLAGKGGPGKEGPTYEEEELDEGFGPVGSKALMNGNFATFIKARENKTPVTLQIGSEEFRLTPTLMDAMAKKYEADKVAADSAYAENLPNKQAIKLIAINNYRAFGYPQLMKAFIDGVATHDNTPPANVPGEQLPMFEKNQQSQKKNSKEIDTPQRSDVQRYLTKVRQANPNATSDLEAVAKSELDHQANTDKTIRDLETINARQDAVLKQSMTLDRQQGNEIDNIENQVNQLSQRLQSFKTAKPAEVPSTTSMPATSPATPKPVSNNTTPTPPKTTAPAEPIKQTQTDNVPQTIYIAQPEKLPQKDQEIYSKVKDLETELKSKIDAMASWNAIAQKDPQSNNELEDLRKEVDRTRNELQQQVNKLKLSDPNVIDVDAWEVIPDLTNMQANNVTNQIKNKQEEFVTKEGTEKSTGIGQMTKEIGQGQELQQDPTYRNQVRRTQQQLAQRQQNRVRQQAGYGDDADEFDDIPDINEGAMNEIDIMRQDLERMNERQFYTAYGISKAAFQQKYRTLLKPALDESQRLHQGDPIVVTGPNEFEGKTGEIYDFSPSGTFVIVNLYNHGKHSMHLSDIAYNEYADQEQDKEDDWYDDEELNEFAPGADRDDDEVPDQILKLANRWWNATDDQPKITNVLRSLGWSIAQVESEDDAVQLMHNDGTVVFISADDFDPDMFEGWSDAIVAQRTGQPRTPYSVYIKGKKWKDFENDDHAEAVANKLRAKFKAEGRDPSVITIAPTDYDKKSVNELDTNTLKSYADKRGAQVAAMKTDNPNPTTGSPEWIKQAVPAQQVNLAKRKIARKERQQGVTEEVNKAGALKAAQEAAKFIIRNLDDRAALKDYSLHFWSPEKFYQGATMAMRGVGFDEIVRHISQDQPAQFETKADPTGSWVVYNDSKVKRFKTHSGAKAYAEKAGGKVASSEYYADKIQKSGVSEAFENGSKVQHPKYGAGQVYKVYPNGMISVNFPEYLDPMSKKPGITGNFNPGDSDYQSLKEAQTDYQKRRQRERDVDAGRPVKPVPKNPQTDYARKRAQDKRDMELGEGADLINMSDLQFYKELLGVMVIPVAAFGAMAWNKAMNAIKLYRAEDVITALQKKGVTVDRSTLEQIKPLLLKLEQAIDVDKDGDTAKELAKRIQQTVTWGKLKQANPKTDAQPTDTKLGEGLMKEPANRKEYLDQRDKLFRMLSVESDSASKQIIKQAIKDLDARYGSAKDPVKEESSTSSDAVERAILNRIMVAHTDLLMKFGPEKVMQAAEEVAYNVGDVDEIGTSDVSAYVAQVKQILGVPEELDEKWSQKYKSSINCANPKGFSQKAHCAGKKK